MQRGKGKMMFPVALWSPSSWWFAGRIHMNQDISKVKIYYSKEKSVDTKRKRYTQANTTEAFFVLHLQGWHGHSCLLEWKSHEKKDTNHAQKSFWLNIQANNFLEDKIVSNKAVCMCVCVCVCVCPLHIYIYIYIHTHTRFGILYVPYTPSMEYPRPK